MNRYTVAVLVRNQFGVLNRVTSMFRRRQFNISALTVSETESSEYSRITVIFDGDELNKQQLINQGAEVTLSAAEERALKKKQEAEERRLRREKERLEALIDELETKIAETEAEMCKPENLADHQLLHELSAKNTAFKDELDAAYESWMEF